MDAYDHRRPFHLFINQYSSLFSILYISSILQSLLLVHSPFSMSCQLVVTYIFRVYLRYQPVVVQLKMMQWNGQIIKVNPTAKLGYLQINDITHSHFKSASTISTYTHHSDISMNHHHKIAIRIETISCIQTHTHNQHSLVLFSYLQHKPPWIKWSQPHGQMYLFCNRRNFMSTFS